MFVGSYSKTSCISVSGLRRQVAMAVEAMDAAVSVIECRNKAKLKNGQYLARGHLSTTYDVSGFLDIRPMRGSTFGVL